MGDISSTQSLLYIEGDRNTEGRVAGSNREVTDRFTEEVILSGTEGPAMGHRGACKEAQEWGKALEQGWLMVSVISELHTGCGQ